MFSRGWDRRTTVFLAFAFLFGSTANLAQAQVFDLEKERVQMAELHGFWRFHSGDDPEGKLGWAQPCFDDSQRSLIRADQGWPSQGYAGYNGLAWYRLGLRLPAVHGQLALYVPSVDVSKDSPPASPSASIPAAPPPSRTPAISLPTSSSENSQSKAACRLASTRRPIVPKPRSTSTRTKTYPHHRRHPSRHAPNPVSFRLRAHRLHRHPLRPAHRRHRPGLRPAGRHHCLENPPPARQ